MEFTRRDALRAGGGLLAAAGAGFAGCVEQRVTREETRFEESTVWTVTPEDATAALSQSAFENYTDRMQEQYGDSGVWGLETERPDSFETAYVQRVALSRETPGSPVDSDVSLVPDDVDPEAPLLVGNACVSMYDLGDGRHRYWLWIAADAAEDRLARDLRLDSLGIGVRLQDTSLADAAEPSVSDGEASVGIGSGGPAGSFPLRGGDLESTVVRDEGGAYETEWSGDLNGRQSINGVCEEQRSGEYDFFWTSSLGYRFDRTV